MAIVARGLAAIAAKAGTYPAYVKDFGRTLCAFASVVKEYVDSASVTMTNKTLTSPVVTSPTVSGNITENSVVKKEATGTISSAEILALNATSKVVIAAPGAGKAIVVDEVQLFLDYGSAGYAADAGEDLVLQYTTGGVDILSIDNDAVAFLTATADAHWIGQPGALYDAQAAGTGDGVLISGFDNESVEFAIAGSGEVVTGDSPIKYRISYREVTYLS
jgi:hypothetical protein